MNNLKTTNWSINEENFQKLFEINICRQQELLQPKIMGGPITKNQLINMKILGQELINSLGSQTIYLKEFFAINDNCITEILDSKANTINFHLIQLDDLSTFSEDERKNMIGIKENEVQFAVNYDEGTDYYLVTDVVKPINISNNIKNYFRLFNENIKPLMDKDISSRTEGIKKENTSKIFVPLSDFVKYKSSSIIYLNSSLSDINFDNIFHSITHIYNFTVAISEKKLTEVEILSMSSIDAAQDVWHTCKPYCSGTGGGII